jgi:folate-binding protein YgfZ
LSYYLSNIGLAKILGNDALDFLNRMSTNDLTDLVPGHYKKTILTNDKGRIIDLIYVLNAGNFSYLLTSAIYLDKVIEHLDKFVIMDDVKFEKINDAANLYTKLESIDGDKTEFNVDNDLILFYDNFKLSKKILIDIQNKGIPEAEVVLPNEEFEKIRIENLIPVAPNEINDNINPVECGLNEYISYTKGCYIGQEVIARLDAQGKIPKQMKLFSCDDYVNINDKIYFELKGEKKECGFVSSYLNKRKEGLCFIRSVSLNPDYKYFVNTDNNFIQIKIK